MRKVCVVGENYSGFWKRTRYACRAVVIEDGMMLLSYEVKTDQWMLPGGGMLQDEDSSACAVRETSEETGYVIDPSDCALELAEYYEDVRYVSCYYLGRLSGKTERQLTEREAEVQMEPRWVPVSDVPSLFSGYRKYRDIDEMRRGLYQRELIAISVMNMAGSTV